MYRLKLLEHLQCLMFFLPVDQGVLNAAIPTESAQSGLGQGQ